MIKRRTGLTTNQMLKAPIGAIYVWVNSDLYYPKNLARDLGRQDLKIVSQSWLTSRNCIGRRVTGLVIDHTVGINKEQKEVIKYLRSRSFGM